MASQSGQQYFLTNEFDAFQKCSTQSVRKTGKFNTATSLKTKAFATLLVAAAAIAPTYVSASSLASQVSPDAIEPPVCSGKQMLVGDGNPHQNFNYRQVTQNLECGSGGCSTSELDLHTFGWTATVSGAEFIGFSAGVSESWTSGQTYTCSISDGTVCLWVKQANTAVTIGKYHCYGTNCGCHQTSTFVEQQPNNNNQGGEYQCRYNSNCTYLGDNYWDYNGCAGGP
ncbi:hypothetical protein K437DRAFT_86952 [Tilletiaria anomala UBC 951]|uniref:Uncharacterized protein n=1 Tax=Tilletiaria anomala (strain ATCC 24038 / CBS 436.72 / UBC 951) TaxID=1037660 RepID=A0A066V8K5_TILAU|nr:uncharacterized protein K437DRAFT_86952 [Tilletiaria anomala UBC 951]KDN34915.1 hypothetical protein K437DRAFT_86952 [Tilletiaria anomala UBC 951]